MRVSNAFTTLQLKTVKPVVSMKAAGTDFRVPADGANPELNTDFIYRDDCSRTAVLAKPGGGRRVLVLPPTASW